jgi:hypothetical protein
MSGLSIGDRVELIRDLEHRYHSRIGIITAADEHSVPVLKEFAVKLADGTEAHFSGFQLKVPPATDARRVIDGAVYSATGMRGAMQGRHLVFGADDFDLHLKVVQSQKHKKVIGQLSSRNIPDPALVTLLVRGNPRQTATTDGFGEFMFQEVPAGNVSIEILVPSRRILATFDA